MHTNGAQNDIRRKATTQTAWETIRAGNGVAQEFAPPGERQIIIDGHRTARKVDVRLYSYDCEVLLTAARLYQGQTTNFRTLGSGLAPVFFV